MIPPLLLAGFIAGFLPIRGALVAVVVLGLGWSALLLGDGTVSGAAEATLAAILGLANAAVGATVSQSARLAIRHIASGR